MSSARGEEQIGSACSLSFFSWTLRRSTSNVFIDRIETTFRSPKKINTVEGYTDLALMTRYSAIALVVSNPDGSMRLSAFLYIPAEQVECASVSGYTKV
jgi:hypothetical protein